jgi:hypothetical protein
VTDCCCRCILKNQPDFKAQKSLVEEIIEEAGYRCIFLPTVRLTSSSSSGLGSNITFMRIVITHLKLFCLEQFDSGNIA